VERKSERMRKEGMGGMEEGGVGGRERGRGCGG
jgi:hypothetical protein